MGTWCLEVVAEGGIESLNPHTALARETSSQHRIERLKRSDFSADTSW